MPYFELYYKTELYINNSKKVLLEKVFPIRIVLSNKHSVEIIFIYYIINEYKKKETKTKQPPTK